MRTVTSLKRDSIAFTLATMLLTLSGLGAASAVLPGAVFSTSSTDGGSNTGTVTLCVSRIDSWFIVGDDPDNRYDNTRPCGTFAPSVVVTGYPEQATANPPSGYVFDHWELDGQYFSDKATITREDHLPTGLSYFPSYYWNAVITPNPGKYAVIVGIEDYSGTGNDNVRDADLTAERYDVTLRNLGFTTRLLTDKAGTSADNGNGAKQTIMDALEWLALEPENPNDIAFFYVLAHGIQAWIAPHSGGDIYVGEVTSLFDPTFTAGQKLVVVIDACESGAWLYWNGDGLADGDPNGRVVITSTAADQDETNSQIASWGRYFALYLSQPYSVEDAFQGSVYAFQGSLLYWLYWPQDPQIYDGIDGDLFVCSPTFGPAQLIDVGDLVVVRPPGYNWFMRQSDGSSSVKQWGRSGDVPLLGDVDGDLAEDIVIWRPSNGVWFVLKSSSGYVDWLIYQWGTSGDVPLLADFDADGRDDLVVWRPSNGVWFILKSSGGYAIYQWGTQGDRPLIGYFDDDENPDLIVWRPRGGVWFILKSSTSYRGAAMYQWGASNDTPVLGDFDGDRRLDLVVWRPSNGVWFVLKSSANYGGWLAKQWGARNDVPLTGIFDGDSRSEMVVWRPSNGVWFILNSEMDYTSWSLVQWGAQGDRPLTV